MPSLPSPGFNQQVLHRPELVCRPTTAAQTSEAVALAVGAGRRLTVQAAGHGATRPMRGGVLVDTRELRGVTVAPDRRTAYAEAGATWANVLEQTAPAGLAPLSGSFPGVTAVPYTLSSGVGLLGRRYGFAADRVVRMQVVTVDGRLRWVDDFREPELFWALRGGGGSFGIVTAMEIELVPVATVRGGSLTFDLAADADIIDSWQQWTTTVPDEMTSAVIVLPFPDVPGVPEEVRGRHIAQISLCYCGPVAGGEEVVAPLRAAGRVLVDTVRPLPYAESGAIFAGPDQPHPYRGQGVLLSGLPTERPDWFRPVREATRPSAPGFTVAGIRHLGGRFAHPPARPNAVGHRDAAYSLGLLSLSEPDATSEATAELADRHAATLAAFDAVTLGQSLNYCFAPLSPEEVAGAFAPADYERLRKLRTELDPDELLQANHPIPPLTSSGAEEES